MPNWTSNTLALTAECDEGREALAHFREQVRVEREDGTVSEFSFQGHVPMPKQLDIGGAPLSRINNDEELMEAMNKMNHPDTKEHEVTILAKNIQQYANKKELGYSDWYMWSVDHWGTKWDAKDVEYFADNENEVCVIFQTAWSMPAKWADAVLNDPRYASLHIELSWTDEGDGACIVSNEGVGEAIDCDDDRCGSCSFYERRQELVKEPNATEWKHSVITPLQHFEGN